MFADPQVRARGMEMTMMHGSGAELHLVANPARLSQTPVNYRLPPPLLGEHTREVLQRLLHIDAAELHRLSEAGTI